MPAPFAFCGGFTLLLLQAGYGETLSRCGGEADLVLFSPPYGDARTYGMDASWGDADYAALGDAVFSALKPGGHALVNVDSPVREWRPGFGTERGFAPWKMMLDWGERIGFRVVERLSYGRLGVPGAYNGRFRNDWEPLFWFQKPGARGFFDKWAVAESAQHSMKGIFSGNRRVDGGVSNRVASGRAVEEGVRHRSTYWGYGSVGHGNSGAVELEKTGHPARWPYRLAYDLVRCFSGPDSLVCDPFLGSGTTGLAVLRSGEGRRFIGGDLGCREDGVPWVDVARGILSRADGAAESADDADGAEDNVMDFTV